ncbi:nitrogenase-stabilizing/protective protein NifW [Mariprofundus ferrooxydans]|uniref:nitrogenase-stabilizing/protective protein NifW n=1 Tax=Mariprofundus ferrooxydans TaxID=314344 RepID=UPI001431B922|nr:nitrogenase-stabilizing/protective protein NifW [Mariprofundus ferrooxydans]
MQDLQDFDEEMEELSSAEDFLEYFDIAFDPSVVHVNRLHILQRFHDYLSKELDLDAQLPSERYARHKLLLNKAYLDFVDSDAQTEKVLKIFRMNEPQTGFVSVEQLLGG